MSKRWNYKSGDWWLQCDVCSKKIKASEAKHRWDGYVVCEEDYENRHPQDFIRAKMDKISVPFTRPRSPDVFVTGLCDVTSRMDAADWGTADCATVGVPFDFYEACPVIARSSIAGVGIAGCITPGFAGYF